MAPLFFFMTRFMFIALLALAMIFPGNAPASESGSDGKILNGMAPLYVALPGGESRHLTATLTLPRMPENKNWYANWVMIVGTAANSDHQIFLQAGMIRRPGAFDRLKAFVSWQGAADSTIHYKELADIPTGPHVFEIRQVPNGFSLLMDGTVLSPPIAMSFNHAYFQLGPEVYQEGDSLAGTVAHIVVEANGISRDISGENVCRYQNHGVQLVSAKKGFTADGVFNRTKPSMFLGDCKGI